MDNTRAGISPAEMAVKMEQAKMQRAAQAAQRRDMCMALAHVLGFEGERSEDQRKVWNWLTVEMWSKLDEPEPTKLAIFEGRRQKAVEAMVMLEEAKRPPS